MFYIGCQLFVERSLDDIMHRQHFRQTFFEVVKTYKSVISPSLFSYWEILSYPQLNNTVCFPIIFIYFYAFIPFLCYVLNSIM